MTTKITIERLAETPEHGFGSIIKDVYPINMKCSKKEFENLSKSASSGNNLVFTETTINKRDFSHTTLAIIDLNDKSKALDYDDELEEMVFFTSSKDKNLVNAYMRKGNSITIGKLRPNQVKTVTVTNGKSTEYYQDIGVMQEMCKDRNIRASNIDNVFIRDNIALIQQHTQNIHSFSYRDMPRHYEADKSNPVFNQVTETYYNRRKSIPVTSNMSKLWSLLGGKSFGIEYEVSRGNINSAYLGWLGLVPVLDGSIGTDFFQEYPTVILNSVQDLATIKEQCKVLDSACLVDQRCALHVHIGNISKKLRKNVVALYTLAYRIQEEMFNIVHPYKKDEIGTLQKAKNYSRPLIDLGMDNYKELAYSTDEKKFKEAYNLIHEYFTTSNESVENIEKESPRPWNRKWHCPTRYQWFNMLNYIMNGGTIEIRLMTPTTKFELIMPWIIINTLIIRYAETYPDKIIAHHDKITLVDIINEVRTNFGTVEDDPYFNMLHAYLLRWVELRKKRYRKLILDINRGLVGGDTAQFPRRIGQDAINEITGNTRINELGITFNPENKDDYIV